MASRGRLRRVPYGWILAAMLLGSAVVFRGGETTVRWVWLLVAGPLAGLALGVERDPETAHPRFGPLAWVGAAGWLYIATILGVNHAKSHGPLDFETALRIEETLITLWFAPVALSLLSLVVAAARPGRYRELGIFLNAAFLLLFALGWDMTLTPR